ncbi:MAG: hypothetical protein D6714_10840, partial [Bacteroidetes bacterium]
GLFFLGKMNGSMCFERRAQVLSLPAFAGAGLGRSLSLSLSLSLNRAWPTFEKVGWQACLICFFEGKNE